MPLAAIILLTILVRVAFCFGVYPAISAEPVLQGHDGYDDIARNLLHGSGYTLVPGGQPTINRLPLYPILLYLIYAAAGEHLWAVQVVQVFLAAVTAWLIFLIGKALFSGTVGLLAAAAFAMHPHLVHYTARPYTETVYVLLICLLAYLLLDAPGPAPGSRGLAPGAVFGLAMLTKDVGFAFPVFFFLGLLLDPSRRRSPSHVRRYLLFFVIGGAIVVSPWVYRNYALIGRLVLSSAWGGTSLYKGLYVSSHLGDGRTPGALDEAASLEYQQVVSEQIGPVRDAVDEYRADRLAYSLAFKNTIDRPYRAGMLFLRNLLFVWFLTRSTLFTSLGFFIHSSLLGLSLYGFFWMMRHDRRRLGRFWAIGSLIIYFNVVYGIAYPFVRYILPVVPLLAVLASFGLVRILNLDGPSHSIHLESGEHDASTAPPAQRPALGGASCSAA
jgi:4-amino-4-deoxy-L-arabinose transferase-like glycosyltransferase